MICSWSLLISHWGQTDLSLHLPSRKKEAEEIEGFIFISYWGWPSSVTRGASLNLEFNMSNMSHMSNMSNMSDTFFWNVRGINDAMKHRSLSKWLNGRPVSFGALLETHVSVVNYSSILSTIGPTWSGICTINSLILEKFGSFIRLHQK